MPTPAAATAALATLAPEDQAHEDGQATVNGEIPGQVHRLGHEIDQRDAAQLLARVDELTQAEVDSLRHSLEPEANRG
jgi:hypothetical protein